MKDRIPFGFIVEKEAASYIVQEHGIEVLNVQDWDPLAYTCGYRFKVQEFWEDVAECIERDKKARAEYELVRNDFRCPVSSVRRLIEELVCRDVWEEKIILLMDQRVYRGLAYDVALEYGEIGEHHKVMTARQALLFDGAYIRVGFSKFLPVAKINFDCTIQTQIVAVTFGQVVIDLPDWCRSGRFE